VVVVVMELVALSTLEPPVHPEEAVVATEEVLEVQPVATLAAPGLQAVASVASVVMVVVPGAPTRVVLPTLALLGTQEAVVVATMVALAVVQGAATAEKAVRS